MPAAIAEAGVDDHLAASPSQVTAESILSHITSIKRNKLGLTLAVTPKGSFGPTGRSGVGSCPLIIANE